MTPKSVIVVGMPRSGTSMVAGIFAQKGYFVAEDPESELRVGDHHNPGGYWEAGSLTRMNAEVLAAAGFEGGDNTWLGPPISPAEARRIESLHPAHEHSALVAAYEASAPWLWKDPRLCYTLTYWWPLVRADRTRVLLTVRDPAAIYQSFIRLRWREPGEASRQDVLARIEDHLRAARAAVARWNVPHMEVRYEDFARRTAGMADELSTFLDLELTPQDLGFEAKLNRSSLRGRVATLLDRGYGALPTPLKMLSKRLTPSAVQRLLYPERSSNTGGRRTSDES